MTTTSTQYAESDMYAAKYKQLQGQAMGAIQQRFALVFRQAVDTVVDAAKQEGVGGGGGRGGGVAAVLGGLPAGAESGVVVVRFRAVVEAGLKGWCFRGEGGDGVDCMYCVCMLGVLAFLFCDHHKPFL